MEVVLVINSGSSSIKYQLIDINKQQALCSGIVERIGLERGIITHKTFLKEDKKHVEEFFIPSHKEGLKRVSELLSDKEYGVISNPDVIKIVGHRLVHGGDKFSSTVLITNEVKDKIRELFSLAPLHNPPTLQGVEVAESIFPKAKQVGVFDTSFHQTMPEEAFRYAIGRQFYEKNRIRKYGFHGTSHKYVSEKAIEYIQKKDSNIITIHLGNGSSMAAIKNGKSIDTTMGLTPLDGLIMGTRCGSIDPGVLFYMQENLGYSQKDLSDLMNKESGIKGLTGHTDMRDVEDAISKEDKDSILAYDMYAYRVKNYIGAYAAVMNGLDAIVFTAGIGENSVMIRSKICENMDYLGIKIDELKNSKRESVIRDISAKDSKTRILVIPTNEELEIANQSYNITK